MKCFDVATRPVSADALSVCHENLINSVNVSVVDVNGIFMENRWMEQVEGFIPPPKPSPTPPSSSSSRCSSSFCASSNFGGESINHVTFTWKKCQVSIIPHPAIYTNTHTHTLQYMRHAIYVLHEICCFLRPIKSM